MSKGNVSRPRISLPLRAAIVVLHVVENKGFAYIEHALGVDRSTARKTFERVKERAEGSDDIQVLLKTENLEDREHDWHSLPRTIEPDGPEAKHMRELALQDPEHYEMPPPEIAKEAGLDISQSYAYRIQSEFNNIGRYVGAVKPDLTEEHKRLRVAFADWALDQPEEEFLFSDETWIEIGKSRKKKRISRPQGESNPFDFTVRNDDSYFPLMISACVGVGIKGPIYIWRKESKQDRQVNNAKLVVENANKRRKMNSDREMARQEGTEQHRCHGPPGNAVGGPGNRCGCAQMRA